MLAGEFFFPGVLVALEETAFIIRWRFLPSPLAGEGRARGGIKGSFLDPLIKGRRTIVRGSFLNYPPPAFGYTPYKGGANALPSPTLLPDDMATKFFEPPFYSCATIDSASRSGWLCV
jgi:hypothetical protein